MYFEWNSEKNKWLKENRGVTFEAVQTAIEAGDLLDIHAHPNKAQYPKQKRLVVRIDSYVYLVPCIPQERDIWFLKTIIPSRKATKNYITQSDI